MSKMKKEDRDEPKSELGVQVPQNIVMFNIIEFSGLALLISFSDWV